MDAINPETPKTGPVGSSDSHHPSSPKDDAKVKKEQDELAPSDLAQPDSKSEILSTHDNESEPDSETDDDNDDDLDILVRYMAALYLRQEDSFNPAPAPDAKADAQEVQQFSHIHILSQMLGQQINLAELLPPPCTICGLDPKLCITSPFNKNGNACRPYFICPECSWQKRWVTWGDAVGVGHVEGECDCGFPVRLDHVGVGKVGTVPGAAGLKEGAAGDGFYCCAAGSCGYWDWE